MYNDNLHISILKDLVSFESITPNGDKAIQYCSELLHSWGFTTNVYKYNGVSNLYAKLYRGAKSFCIAGHIDVVPPLDNWTYNPWQLTEHNGCLYGRGTNDMKGPLSAALAAVYDFIKNSSNLSIVIMMTSDEEIMTDNGMKSLVQELINKSEYIDYCILPESCSPGNAGEYIKIGCKGSLNTDLISHGIQCHVASGNNHIHKFIGMLFNTINNPIDNGNKYFEPSSIQITSIDINNSIRNIIPSTAFAKLNIRFNDNWTHDTLEQYIISKLPDNIECLFQRFGYPFIGAANVYIDKLKKVLRKINNKEINIGTYGGNSDALSLHKITQVVEIGSSLAQAHITNEYITRSDMDKLRTIYKAILEEFEKNP